MKFLTDAEHAEFSEVNESDTATITTQHWICWAENLPQLSHRPLLVKIV